MTNYEMEKIIKKKTEDAWKWLETATESKMDEITIKRARAAWIALYDLCETLRIPT